LIEKRLVKAVKHVNVAQFVQCLRNNPEDFGYGFRRDPFYWHLFRLQYGPGIDSASKK
jgi:hypothetical protein